MTTHYGEVTGDRTKVQYFQVFRKRQYYFIHVRELVPIGVNGPVVGVALEGPLRRTDALSHPPRRHHRGVRVCVGVVTVQEVVGPVVEPCSNRVCGCSFQTHKVRVELLQVVGRSVSTATTVAPGVRACDYH